MECKPIHYLTASDPHLQATAQAQVSAPAQYRWTISPMLLKSF